MVNRLRLRIPKKTALLAVALLAAIPVLQLTGCAGPGYYVQAVSGHLRLMHAREPVEDVLARSDTDPDVAGKLALTEALKSFAVEQLDLPPGESYSEFVATHAEAVVWNVVAAPEFSLEARRWCFLFAGCVTYRGYFARDDADRFASKMNGQGYDVSVTPAAAYSTLGWFDDPLLDTMLRYDDVQLAALLFHELAHSKLYVKGDTAFNEAYANAVELIGVRLWLDEQDRAAELVDWLAVEEAGRDFNALIDRTRDRLREIYASPADAERMREAKSREFDALAAGYERLVSDRWGGERHFAGWLARSVNNASLALMNSYRGGECAFADLWERSNGDIATFHALAAEKGSLAESARSAWLDSPCPGIATEADL